MPVRPYWQGQIRLALVTIPVQVFTATKAGSRIAFNQIHKPSGKRIRYEKVVPGIGPVDTDDIVKGYEVEKGQYVLLTDEEIDHVKLEAKRTLDLVQFVDKNEIDPIYFDRPFFVSPDEDDVAREAYVVLREALKETGKIGLGQLVIRGRGSVVALKPSGKGLLLETLRYADEIQRSDSFFADIPATKPDRELLGLAEELIERKARAFDPKVFKDSYDDALRELIDAKLKHRKPLPVEEERPSAKVIDLMEALRRSISGKSAAARTAGGEVKGKSRSQSRRRPAKSARGRRAA